MNDNKNILGIKSTIYDCGFCKNKDVVLKIPYRIWADWLYVMHEMGKLEYSAFFKVVDGEVVEWVIPKQTVTGTESEIHEDLGFNGIVHSHHSMGAFHSGQDNKAVRNIHDWSIVISHTGYDASNRRNLPCGGFGYSNVVVELFAIDPQLLDGITRIEEKKAPQTNNTWSDGDWEKEWEKERKLIKDEDRLDYKSLWAKENQIEFCVVCGEELESENELKNELCWKCQEQYSIE